MFSEPFRSGGGVTARRRPPFPIPSASMLSLRKNRKQYVRRLGTTQSSSSSTTSLGHTALDGSRRSVTVSLRPTPTQSENSRRISSSYRPKMPAEHSLPSRFSTLFQQLSPLSNRQIFKCRFPENRLVGVTDPQPQCHQPFVACCAPESSS